MYTTSSGIDCPSGCVRCSMRHDISWPYGGRRLAPDNAFTFQYGFVDFRAWRSYITSTSQMLLFDCFASKDRLRHQATP